MSWYLLDVVDGKVHGNVIINANSIEEAEEKVAKMQEENINKRGWKKAQGLKNR